MLSQGDQNDFQYALDILKDFIVPKPNYSEVVIFKPSGSCLVCFLLDSMLAPIDLNDQSRLVA